MDEIEFRKTVYANPEDPGELALAAARDNPAYQAILEETLRINRLLSQVANDIKVPDGLEARLREIPEHESAVTEDRGARTGFRKATLAQYYAIAAGLLLAIGIGYSQLFSPGQPMQEAELPGQVLAHMVHEQAQMTGIRNGSLDTAVPPPVVRRVMASAGASLQDGNVLDSMPVRFASPCLIVPGHDSAHLILDTGDGPLSVIAVRNSPVSREQTFADEQFSGIILPMQAGNLILLVDAEQDIDDYRDLFVDNVDWVI